MTLVRVGRDGFRGSSLTAWCPSCRDFAVPSERGLCMFCDTRIQVVPGTQLRGKRWAA